jgi:hypothetical protein
MNVFIFIAMWVIKCEFLFLFREEEVHRRHTVAMVLVHLFKAQIPK